MASSSDIVTKAVNEALEQIRKHAPEQYAKLEADPAKKKQLIQATRATATECVQLAAELAGQPTDIAERLAKHLPKDRIDLIRSGLSVPTFRMDLVKKADGKHHVKLSRGGASFMTGTRNISTVADVDWGNTMQMASILVEAILLVMSAVGIAPSVSESTMEHTVEEVVREINSTPALKRAVEEFVTAWNAAGGNAWNQATALFNLIKDSFAGGIFWTIVDSLISEMAWYDWLEATAKVTAMIVAAIATDGLALIGEIALIVLSAVDFARKIANIVGLNEVKKTL